jgi:chromosome partitioning protein
VALVDSDPQGSARDWAAQNQGLQLEVLAIDRPTHSRDLRAFAHYDYVVIDGAPQVHALAQSAIAASTFVLIPVSPSPYDYWATTTLVELVKSRIEIEGPQALSAAFVITRTLRNTKLAKAIREPLDELGLHILNTQIVNRVAYPTSATTGHTVLDQDPNGEAAVEFRKLVAEIEELLPKLPKPNQNPR